MSQTEVQLIKDAVIVNADISNSAAIDVSKISGAMPLAGGTFTNDVTFDGATAGRDILFDRSNNFLKFKDNAKISLGTGDEANLYYDGTNPIFYAGTNTLRIVADNIHLEAGDFGDEFLRCNHDGAVALYFDNSQKLSTTSSGVSVAGTLSSTNYSSINLSASVNHIQWPQDASASDSRNFNIIGEQGSYGVLDVKYSNARDENPNEKSARFIANGGVELYHNNVKKFETLSTGVDITGDLIIDGAAGGTLTLGGSSAHTSKLVIASNDGSSNGNLLVEGGDGGDFFTINSAGNVKFEDSKKALFGTGSDLEIFHDGTHSRIVDNGANPTSFQSNLLRIHDNSGNFEYMAEFNANGEVELFYDNVKRFETQSDGVRSRGLTKHLSEDQNTTQTIQPLYLSIPTNTTKTITLTLLLGTATFTAGGYANAGQGALALRLFFGGAMFGTQHYNVDVNQNSAMQNTSITLTKNATSYVIAIANNSSTFSLNLNLLLESTGRAMGYAVA